MINISTYMYKNYTGMGQDTRCYRNKLSIGLSGRIKNHKIADEGGLNPNFSELFYQKVASLRKLFGIRQDFKVNLVKAQCKTPKPLASTREISLILPPKVKIVKKRKDNSVDRCREYRSNPFTRRHDQTFIEDTTKIRIRKNVSSNHLEKKKISINLKHLPFISKSKSNLLKEVDDEYLSGWC